MDCTEFRPQLELLALGGLEPAAEARAREHLARCPQCREAARQCRSLVAEVRQAGLKAVPRPEFVESLREAVLTEARARRPKRGMRRFLTATAAAAAALLLGAAVWDALPSGPSPSPRPAGDPASTASLVGGASAGEKWNFGGASALTASSADGVVVRDDRMYYLRRHGQGYRVAEIDLATGRSQWESQAESIGYLAADANQVYCLAPAGPRKVELVALDAASGTQRWRYTGEQGRLPAAPCPPVPVGGDRVAWVTHATVHVIDARAGRLVWKHTIEGGGPISAVASDGAGLFVAGANALHCIDAASGREAWQAAVGPNTAGIRRPLLSLADGKAFLAHRVQNGATVLRCLNVNTHQVQWRTSVGDVRHLLATRDGVYVRGLDVQAYDRETGLPLWRRQADGCSRMTAHEGLLYLIDSREGGRLVVLDQHSGTEAWAVAGIRSCDAFRRVGRTGYVKTQDGVIHAIALLSR